MCNVNGEHLDYYAYNNYLGEGSLRTLGRKVPSHIMRHTHVSPMAEAGIPLETITRRVGHENNDVTREVYLHITQRRKEDDREQLKAVKFCSLLHFCDIYKNKPCKRRVYRVRSS